MVFIPTLLVLATVATLTSADSVWINCDNNPAYAASSIKSSSLACDSFCYTYAYVYWRSGDGACRCSNSPTPIQSMVGSTNLGGSCPSGQFNCLSATNGVVNPYVQQDVPTVAACWDLCASRPGPPGYASYKASNGKLECQCFSSFTGGMTNCGSGSTYVWQYGPNTVVSNIPRRRQLAAQQQAAMIAEQHPYCPPGLSACRVNGLGSNSGFECINPQTEVESCGGCLYGTMKDVNNATGVDCTALDGTAKTGVTCIRGECHAWLCKRGYKLVDGVCVPK